MLFCLAEKVSISIRPAVSYTIMDSRILNVRMTALRPTQGFFVVGKTGDECPRPGIRAAAKHLWAQLERPNAL